MERNKGQAGGGAMHAGARYQNRVTAWLAAKVLSERTPTLLLRGKLVLQLIDWLGGGFDFDIQFQPASVAAD